MQFRNSKDGEGTSPRGSQKATLQVNNASVITADEDVLHEALVYNTTLESPLQQTVLHNWKKKAVNYGPYPEYHEREQEYHEP